MDLDVYIYTLYIYTQILFDFIAVLPDIYHEIIRTKYF